jgi:hypothetical protein
MTATPEKKPTTRKRPTRGPANGSTPAPMPAEVVKPTCNVPGCTNEPTTRGLCDPHWATHRGLANPKEDRGHE